MCGRSLDFDQGTRVRNTRAHIAKSKVQTLNSAGGTMPLRTSSVTWLQHWLAIRQHELRLAMLCENFQVGLKSIFFLFFFFFLSDFFGREQWMSDIFRYESTDDDDVRGSRAEDRGLFIYLQRTLRIFWSFSYMFKNVIFPLKVLSATFNVSYYFSFYFIPVALITLLLRIHFFFFLNAFFLPQIKHFWNLFHSFYSPLYSVYWISLQFSKKDFDK